MSEEDKQKIIQAFEKVFDEVKRIVEEIVKIVRPIIEKIIKKIKISVIKILNDKKACKCLHIWLHTKNHRIRKKQSKRISKFILSYMPL